MKTARKMSLVCLALALATGPGLANDKGKNKRSSEEAPAGTPAAREAGTEIPTGASESSRKEPWVKVDVAITPHEREVIQDYVQSYNTHGKSGKKAKNLPPGLAKKVARGGQLPPGWQRKCVKGEIMPVEVYKQCHPLPQEVVVKLPPPPSGTITVAVSGKVVRLLEATREILDVFDVRI